MLLDALGPMKNCCTKMYSDSRDVFSRTISLLSSTWSSGLAKCPITTSASFDFIGFNEDIEPRMAIVIVMCVTAIYRIFPLLLYFLSSRLGHLGVVIVLIR
jgi:hypothetical protein